MRVTGIAYDSTDSSFTISCQDYGRRLLDTTVNKLPGGAIPQAGASNTGNGVMSSVAVMPFGVINEIFTVTCTTAGTDGVALFSVVGSSSGSLGTATSGTEFTTGSRIKFTIRAGTTNWALLDRFQFSTFAPIQFTDENPINVLWQLLTGYDFSTGLAKNYLTQTPQFDNTRGPQNVDIDWESFAVAARKASFTLKGWLPYDSNLVEIMQDIIVHFLGSIYVNEAGKVAVAWFKPDIRKPILREFSDVKKNVSFKYRRETGGFDSSGFFCNYATCDYKATDSWDWTDSAFEYDGFYVTSNVDSVAEYGQFAKNFKSRYYCAGVSHVTYFVDRVVGRFIDPPLVAEVETGDDALLTQLGEGVHITDEKAGLSLQFGEVIRLQKDFSSRPRSTRMSILFEEDAEWGFLGSTENEGDGSTPNASNLADADEDDQRFIYLSHGQDPSLLYIGETLPQNAAIPWTRVDQSGFGTETVNGRVFELRLTQGARYWVMGSTSDFALHARPAELAAAFGFRVKCATLSTMAADTMDVYMLGAVGYGTQFFYVGFKLFSDGVKDYNTGKSYTLKGVEALDPTLAHDLWVEFTGANTYAVYLDGKMLFSDTLTSTAAGDLASGGVRFGVEGGALDDKDVDFNQVWWRTTSPSVDYVPYRMF